MAQQIINARIIDDKIEISNVSEETNKEITTYLTELQKMAKDPEKYLESFDHKKYNDLFCDKEKAISNLRNFKNGLYGKLMDKFSNLNVLIAGSSCLAAVMSSFEPNDMDIYVKDINMDIIKNIDEKIRDVFPEHDIIIIRRAITLTWWISKNDNYVMSVQLNVLNVKSWGEIFLMYHGDLVCIGYDTKLNDLVVLEYRWEKFSEMFPRSYFQNMFGCIKNATQKYANRGFVPYVIFFDKENKPNVTSSISSDDNDDSDNIYNRLKKTYFNLSDFIFSYMISEKIFEKHDYGIMNPITVTDKCELYDFVTKEADGEKECPVLLENYDVGFKSKNCSHEISLKAFIMGSIDACPLCRKRYGLHIDIPEVSGSISVS